MGAAKEGRDRAAMSARIEQERNEPCGMTRRGLSNLMTQVDNEIHCLKAKLEEAEKVVHELEKSRKCIIRLRGSLSEANEKIREAREDCAKEKVNATKWRTAYAEKRKAHIKLSYIIRLTLTPDQWHEARDRYREIAGK